MNSGKIIYLVRDPRSLSHDYIELDGLKDAEKVFDSVKNYCDLTLRNINLLYDSEELRRKIRVLRYEDLFENIVEMSKVSYMFSKLPWNGILSSVLNEWSGKYGLRDNISMWRIKAGN
jgi:hypothetical protein